MDLDQQVQLTEDEDSCGFPNHVNEDDDKLKTFTIREADLRSLIMIGGIEIFLPLAQEEAEIWVADTAKTEGQLAEIVAEELEQISEAAQAGEENEHSKECLDAFSQEAEEAVALKLTAEEAGEDDEHSEEWLNIFSQETEKTATWEFEAEEEETDNIILTDLYEQIEALERRVKVQGMHIQQVKLEADEEGMGDHNDLLMCRKFLQLRRLHEQDQPLGQLDEVIDMIRELMIRSAETVSKETLNRREATTMQQQQQQGDEADEQLQRMIWDPGGFQ
jgi:hypothetical protein